MKKTKKTTTKKLKEPIRSDDLPATKRLLDLTEGRLMGEISSLRREMKFDINSLRTEMKSDMGNLRTEVKSDMNNFRTEIKSDMDNFRTEIKSDMNNFRAEIKSDMDGFKSTMASSIEQMTASMFRIEALVEEQNIRNKVVLDGYTNLYDHQISTNKRLDKLEEVTFGIKQK